MKINTIGLDISEVKHFSKDKISPRNDNSGDMVIEIDTGNANKQQNQTIDNYSSGESEEGFSVKFSKLPQKEKEERLFYLWMLAFKKAKAAAVIVRKHIYINQRIFI